MLRKDRADELSASLGVDRLDVETGDTQIAE
jgi:hypothetical protein